MHILIVGAGAVGGYFGARWIAAGRDVTFLVRNGRRTVLAKAGLTILGSSQDLHGLPSIAVFISLQKIAERKVSLRR